MSLMKKNVALYQMDDIANNLLNRMPTTKIYAFFGPLGAGKTTLVQSVLKQIDLKKHVQSPTFTYVIPYVIGDKTIYHFDLYRISSFDAFIEAGFDEYLYQPNSWAFIEWPEIIRSLLKDDVCRVVLDYTDNGCRSISID